MNLIRVGHPTALAFVVLLSLGSVSAAAGDAEPARPDFVAEVAPILKTCLHCHGATDPKGDLSLTTVAHLIEGEYVIPGKPGESPLIEAVLPGPNGKRPKMPKGEDALSAEQVETLRRWVASGANWPEGLVLEERKKAGRDWWSLRPIVATQPRSEADLRGLTTRAFPEGWGENPIDRFVLAKLDEAGLQPSPPTDKATLLRRLTYDLTGLPPTPDETRAFLDDGAPDAYEKLVDRLLASPAYGEQWGRHWLDVIRFGESTGFERNTIVNNAWPFRDYVIKSFNDDKPFDRMTLEHLAGDVLAPGDPAVAVGTTFLVSGPYDDVGNQDVVQAAQIRADTLDDMIRTTSEAFLGLTVGCARCHDHKFDPIAQADYYRLYAAFAGVSHGSRAVASAEQQKARLDLLKPLEERRDRLARELAEARAAVDRRGEAKAAMYEAAWTRPMPLRAGTEERFAPVEARYVRLVVEGLDVDPRRREGCQIEEFEVWTAGDSPRNVALASAGGRAEGSSRVAGDFKGAYSADNVNDGRYGDRWIAATPELTITLAAPERIDRVTFGSDRAGAAGAVFVSDYRIEVSADGKTWAVAADSHDRKPVNAGHRQARIFDREVTSEERQTLDDLSAQLAETNGKFAAVPGFPVWWVGNFGQPKAPVFLFKGGDPQKKGESIAASSLSMLADSTRPYELGADAPEGERRLALARWLVAPDNPLTPRVLVNRIWQNHFSRGLVETPSDYGMMGVAPSHPELLDWLATQLLADGWKMKPTHRRIVTSRAYRQSGTFREGPARKDGGDRLLWRFPPRRLSAEELRDTLLDLAGKLDRGLGGPGFRLYRYLEDNVATYVPLDDPGPETYRRAVYHQNGRAARVDILSDFDCPDNAFSAPARAATTSPLQALTMLNHKFTLDMAGAFADRLACVADPGLQVREAYLVAYGRPASDAEVKAAETFIGANGLRAFARAVMNSNELLFVR
jgi:mono/diheme cytochrome c family protein